MKARISSAERAFTVPLLVLFVAGLFTQLISISPLWGHFSDGGEFLGRYSARYALVLGAHISLSVSWLIALIFRRQILALLAKLGGRVRLFFIAASLGVLFVASLLRMESHAQQYLAVNVLLFALILCYVPPIPNFKAYDALKWLLSGIVAVLVGAMGLHALVQLPFSPDEAHWADFASTAIVGGGIYARTWAMQPTIILPGLGWSVAAYGWLLENVVFDIRVGRVWNFAFSLLTVGMIWLLANRLYGRTVAWVSACLAALSLVFFIAYDYRPHHQLAFAGALIVYAAVSARLVGRHHYVWHFICGLAATLSLQLHAAGVAFAFGMSVYYAIDTLVISYRDGVKAGARRLLPFVFGAGLGVVIYFAFNIIPVGGLSVYLENLSTNRGYRYNDGFEALRWRSFLDMTLAFAGIIFIVWRRNKADRILGLMFLCYFAGFSLLDTQGYREPLASLFFIPMGAVFTQGFRDAQFPPRQNMAGLLVVAVMILQSMHWINWGGITRTFQDGELPIYLYTELQDELSRYVSDEDVILSSHLLIWTFPDHPSLFTEGAESMGAIRWNISGVEVWERLQPTVVITVQNEISLNEGALAYMERHQFQSCHLFTVQGKQIEILRPHCSS